MTQIIGIITGLLVLVSGIGIFLFFILRAYKKNSTVLNESQDIEGMSAGHSCPKCNQTMERGYALAGRGIIYQPAGGKAISSFVTIMSVLENTMSMSLPPAVNRAWHCNSCKHLLIDHSKLLRQKK